MMIAERRASGGFSRLVRERLRQEALRPEYRGEDWGEGD